MKEIEVELKFEVLNKKEIINFLRNFRFYNKKIVKDVYLDTEDSSLYKKGIFIRIRNEKKLQIKFNPEDVKDKNRQSTHEVCSEFSFDLPLSEKDINDLNEILNFLGLSQLSYASIEELKRENNLIESIIIEKKEKFIQIVV